MKFIVCVKQVPDTSGKVAVKPDGTMVSPGEFIPIFEENGFVTHLDFEMMRQVLDMQQKRMQEGKPIVKVSVNFSRKHQEDQSYLQRLDELMAQYTVPSENLEIEILSRMNITILGTKYLT